MYTTPVSLDNPESEDHHKHYQRPTVEEITVSAETLRHRVDQKLKAIKEIWELNEKDLLTYFKDYECMPHSSITSNLLFELEKVKMIRTEHKLYFGEILQKKKEGRGIAVYREGKVYEGNFHLNEKSGYGVEVYPNGNIYIGDYAQNKKHGKGSFLWFNLSEIDTMKNVEQYHGEWWGGLPDGAGEHLKSNGDFYVGMFKNGLKHGEGSEAYSNGDSYKGDFINGLPEGYGEYRWADDSFFKGDFKQGARNGYGMWKSTRGENGEVYKGHYMLDKKHGYGIYDWGNGYVYKGFWLDDLRYGEGTLLENDEVRYEGYWENGEKANHKPEAEKEKMRETTQTSYIDGFRTMAGNSKVTNKKSTSYDKNWKRGQISAEKKKSARKDNCSTSHDGSREKSRCRHRNCIPNIEFGKMPTPPWKKA